MGAHPEALNLAQAGGWAKASQGGGKTPICPKPPPNLGYFHFQKRPRIAHKPLREYHEIAWEPQLAC